MKGPRNWINRMWHHKTSFYSWVYQNYSKRRKDVWFKFIKESILLATFHILIRCLSMQWSRLHFSYWLHITWYVCIFWYEKCLSDFVWELVSTRSKQRHLYIIIFYFYYEHEKYYYLRCFIIFLFVILIKLDEIRKRNPASVQNILAKFYSQRSERLLSNLFTDKKRRVATSECIYSQHFKSIYNFFN